MTDAPIDPHQIPDIIIALSSEDEKEREAEEQRIKDLIDKYPDITSKEFRYLSKIIHHMYSSRIKINGLKKEFKEKVENHDGINEEAVLLLGTVITAIATSPFGIPWIAVGSGSVIAGLKVVFKWEKGNYRDKMRYMLKNHIETILMEALDRVQQIYNDIYGTEQKLEILSTLKPTVSSMSTALSASTIPYTATFFTFRKNGTTN